MLVLLAGCGGGGGGGATTASATPSSGSGTITAAGPTGAGAGTSASTGAGAGAGTIPVTGSSGPTVPIEPAISSLYSTPHHFDKPNNIDPRNGDNYSVVADYTPGADTVFEGVAVKTVAITRDVTKTGTPLPRSSQTDFFQISPYKLIGTTFPGQNNFYVVASAQIALPPTGKPGDTGNFYNSTTYDSAAKNFVVATSTQTWKVSADTDTSVIFCIDSVVTTVGVAGTKTKSDCYRIDTNGTIPSIFFTVPN